MTNPTDPLPIWLLFGLLEMAIGLFFGYLIGSGRRVVISARSKRP